MIDIKYEWNLKDTKFTKDKGKVFSCFSCGGGSTMGYKLAGFDVVGCNEIDKKMMEVYKANHNPKLSYLESITTFKDRDDLPDELYNLDILDGSPPCSSFSIAGNREKDWGKDKKFREGQAEQVLDTLFFDFIDLAKKLKPKVVIAENVKGLLMGNAIDYVKKIYKDFDEAGYYCQHFLLNSKNMGVPQKRERVFFICLRKDLAEPFLYNSDMFTVLPKINIEFNEREILFKDIIEVGSTERLLTGKALELWNKRKLGDIDLSYPASRGGKENYMFNYKFLYDNKVSNTIIGNDTCPLYNEPRYRSKLELCRGGSYPIDYNFLNNKEEYLIGMSVPPLMVAQIADRIFNQWLNKI